jgi:hypothetical protein
LSTKETLTKIVHLTPLSHQGQYCHKQSPPLWIPWFYVALSYQWLLSEARYVNINLNGAPRSGTVLITTLSGNVLVQYLRLSKFHEWNSYTISNRWECTLHIRPTQPSSTTPQISVHAVALVPKIKFILFSVNQIPQSNGAQGFPKGLTSEGHPHRLLSIQLWGSPMVRVGHRSPPLKA